MGNADRIRTIGALVLSMLIASSCIRTDEQSVRHAVTAELIERYRVNEDQVRLIELGSGSGSWVVRAEISSGGRAGARRQLTCRVERSASSASGEARWTLTIVEDREIGASPKQ